MGRDKRTFFVRLNLDDMAAEVVGLESSEERGQWLDGFLIGSRGKDPRENWTPAKLDGHRFGSSCHQEAESFREKKAAAGDASADARRRRYGSAQPNTDRTPIEHRSNTDRTPIEHNPEKTPNQPTSNNQHPEATSQKPTARVAATTFSPTEEHQVIAATRGLDMERQAARFREANREALDTPQSWDRRFSAWLAQGLPEPPPVAPLVANEGQSRTTSRPPFRWAVERDIRESKAELALEDQRYKESRWEANRGTPDSGRHRQAMSESRAKMAQVEARIADLEARLETAV